MYNVDEEIFYLKTNLGLAFDLIVKNQSNIETIQRNMLISYGIITILTIAILWILWNQRKTRKMLREMMEEQEKGKEKETTSSGD